MCLLKVINRFPRTLCLQSCDILLGTHGILSPKFGSEAWPADIRRHHESDVSWYDRYLPDCFLVEVNVHIECDVCVLKEFPAKTEPTHEFAERPQWLEFPERNTQSSSPTGDLLPFCRMWMTSTMENRFMSTLNQQIGPFCSSGRLNLSSRVGGATPLLRFAQSFGMGYSRLIQIHHDTPFLRSLSFLWKFWTLRSLIGQRRSQISHA